MGFGDLAYRCDPSRAALVVVDVQVDFCRPPEGRSGGGRAMEEMGDHLLALTTTAHAAQVPVIFVQTIHGTDSDSPAWRSRRGSLAPYERELCKPGTEGMEFFRVAPRDGDIVIVKHRYDAFVGTQLDEILKSLRREAVILAGTLTDVCVETTLRHAVCLDYMVTLVSDCCASTTVERHELALGRVSESFGSVADSLEIAAMWGSEPPGAVEPALVNDLSR